VARAPHAREAQALGAAAARTRSDSPEAARRRPGLATAVQRKCADVNEDENESGAFDYERAAWEQEQIQADPAFALWLDMIELTQEQTHESRQSQL